MVYGLYFDVTFSAEEDPKSEYMVSQWLKEQKQPQQNEEDQEQKQQTTVIS